MIKLENELRQVKSVAIAGHVRPDGDCTGSCLAVYNYIREHFPAVKAAVYLETVNPSFAMLYRSEEIQTECAKDERYDLFLALDVSDKERMGAAAKYFETAGRRVCIDHGHGIVIGETTEIGDDVMIYQGVTLGGTGKDIGKRHPTIESGVMIGAGAKVLGPITVGKNAKIAAGAVVVKDIEPNCTVVGVPGAVVRIDGERVDDLDQINIPDPIMAAIRNNSGEIEELKKKIKELEEGK